MGVNLHRLGPGRSCREPFWHGCSGERRLLGHEPNYGLGMVLWSSYALETRTRLYDLGMDALVIVCSRKTNVNMARAWMLS